MPNLFRYPNLLLAHPGGLLARPGKTTPPSVARPGRSAASSIARPSWRSPRASGRVYTSERHVSGQVRCFLWRSPRPVSSGGTDQWFLRPGMWKGLVSCVWVLGYGRGQRGISDAARLVSDARDQRGIGHGDARVPNINQTHDTNQCSPIYIYTNIHRCVYLILQNNIIHNDMFLIEQV